MLSLHCLVIRNIMCEMFEKCGSVGVCVCSTDMCMCMCLDDVLLQAKAYEQLHRSHQLLIVFLFMTDA